MSRSDYKNNFASAHYDRIILQVPKGQKDIWKRLASERGLSLNEYIGRLVSGGQEELFDRMQIADKYRRMISSLTGSTKTGYTVTLLDGYVYGDFAAHSFWCRTKPELRQSIKKCHVHDAF